jgi:hypothetical protein
LELPFRSKGVKAIPNGKLAINNNGRRPKPIGLFAKNHRKFNNGVFNKITADFPAQLWRWWILILEGKCVIENTGCGQRPGAIHSNADWSSLLVRGHNEIWQIIVGVVLWRKQMERQSSIDTAHLHAWAEFVVDVRRVLNVMLDVACAPKVKKARGC